MNDSTDITEQLKLLFWAVQDKATKEESQVEKEKLHKTSGLLLDAISEITKLRGIVNDERRINPLTFER